MRGQYIKHQKSDKQIRLLNLRCGKITKINKNGIFVKFTQIILNRKSSIKTKFIIFFSKIYTRKKFKHSKEIVQL